MAARRMHEHEVVAAQKQFHPVPVDDVGRDDLHRVQPGDAEALHLFQMGLTGRAHQRLAYIFVRDDGVGVTEQLVAEGVVAVVMRIDDADDGLVRVPADDLENLLGLGRIDPRIDNDDPLLGDDEGGVGVDALAMHDGVYIFQDADGFHALGPGGTGKN
jgi:hypothetical protein